MRVLILYLLSLYSLQICAQEVSYSELLKLGNLERDVEILGIQNELIVVKAESATYDRDIFILTYDSESLKLKKQNTLKLEFKKPVLEKMYLRNDTLYAFYTAYVENKISLIVSHYTYDYTKAEFTKVLAPLSKRKFISDDMNLMFEHSTDWSHVVILKSRILNGELLISEYFVLKNFTEMVNGGPIESNFRLRPAHFLVSNAGDFFLIYSEALSGLLNNRELHSSYLVEHYALNALRPNEIAITYDGMRVSANYFKLDDMNNMLVASGFYSGKKTRFLEGYMLYRYDYLRGKQDALIFRSFREGRSEKLNRIVSNVWKNKVLNNLLVEELTLRRDGGVLLSGESYRISEDMSSRTSDIVGMNNVTYTHYNKEILVLNISPEGYIDWAEVINKDQISRDDEIRESSYFLMNSSDALHYIYNESLDKNSNLSVSSISYEGEKSIRSLLNVKEKRLKPIPKSAYQISKDTVIIPSIGQGESFFSGKNSLTLIKVAF